MRAVGLVQATIGVNIQGKIHGFCLRADILIFMEGIIAEGCENNTLFKVEIVAADN